MNDDGALDLELPKSSGGIHEVIRTQRLGLR